ncbi:MAG: 16S rRNA (cytosine(967)-C(5))-methyltransferase RsmB [Lachnospiraceae bacterium]|nr:16S rRNA (cytosine(967)-C(5))-methyltransferase RsmB [Lachnospiraceae bacterium]
MTNARDIVLSILLDIEGNNTFSNIAITKALKKHQFEAKKDRAFITRLAQGITESKIKLDYIIDSFSKTPSEKCKPLIRALLRMGVYQIMYMDAVPDSAVCNEAVKLAKKHNFGNLASFVNGVLRAVARNKDNIAMPGKENMSEYLSVNYSMPEWLCKKIMEDYGEKGEKIIAASFDERKTALRVNTLKITREKLKEYIKDEGSVIDIIMEDGIYDENALLVSGYDFIRSMPGYRQGLFFIQDESSMCAIKAAGIKPYQTVVDVCAAPGGKTLNAACYMEGKGKIYARDISDEKLTLIEENVERLDIRDIICIEKWDAKKVDEKLVRKADVVIADLPCSGLGIMGRKNDIKYRIKQEQLDELVALQRDILSSVKQYVKKGGVLLYSTCTINPQENKENTKWFLENNSEFKLCTERQLLQGVDKCDGFYYAVLQRG